MFPKTVWSRGHTEGMQRDGKGSHGYKYVDMKLQISLSVCLSVSVFHPNKRDRERGKERGERSLSSWEIWVFREVYLI